MLTFTSLALAFAGFANSVSLESPNLNSDRALIPIDGNGQFYADWSANSTSQVIQFQFVVATTGYVGFGLSPLGGMNGSDIVIAGVYNNGTTYISDRYGVGQTTPVVDPVQNYQLTNATQNATHTSLSIQRPFATGDSNDVDITNNTITLIYAIGGTDEIEYHFANRGGYVTNLLNP